MALICILKGVAMEEEYREEIIALLDKIKDAGALAYLHTFIKLFAEKWG